MARILPHLPSDQRASPADLERRRETGASGAEGAFADLLHIVGLAQQQGEAGSTQHAQTGDEGASASDAQSPLLPAPTTGARQRRLEHADRGSLDTISTATNPGPLTFSETSIGADPDLPGSTRRPAPNPVRAFEANDLVGRAVSPALNGATSAVLPGLSQANTQQLPVGRATDATQHENMPLPALATSSSGSLARAREPSRASNSSGLAQTGRASVQPSDMAPQPDANLDGLLESPTQRPGRGAYPGSRAAPNIATALAHPADPPGGAAAVAQAVQRSTASPAAASADEGVAGARVLSAPDKMRSLLLEQAREQAQNTAAHVAVVAVEDGIRVVARAASLSAADREKLKVSVSALLAEHGCSNATVLVTTTPGRPGQDSARG